MGHLKATKYTNWIFNSFEVTSEGLGLYRIFASLYILFYLLPSLKIYAFISGLPPGFFAPPPGPFALFNGFPSYGLLAGMYYALIVSLCAMALGLFTKKSSLLSGILFLFLKGFLFSLGKIDHELLLIVVPILMAFSGWGKAYSVDALRKAKSIKPQLWVLTLLALIIGFMFFTAGVPKILGGWLNISTHATEGHFYKQFFVRGRQDLLANYALQLNGVTWEILDYATIIFEIGFLVAIINPVSTRLFICLATFFHFSIMLILNIQFLPNFLAYAAFFNWAWLVSSLRIAAKKWTDHKSLIYWCPPFITGTGMVSIFFLLYHAKSMFTFQSDLTFYAVSWVTIFTIIAMVYFAKECVRIFAK